MTLFMLLVCLVLFVLLIFLAAVRPARSPLSAYELHRRKMLGNKKAEDAMRREELLAAAATLRMPLFSLLLVLIVLLLIVACGWKQGTLIAIVTALLCGRLSQLSFARKLSTRIYRRYETTVLALIAKYEAVIRLIGGKPSPRRQEVMLGSHQELMHVIDVSHNILSEEDKRMLIGAIDFKERLVSEIMTPRENIVTIEQNELLGPLVLSDLYKTGHSSFPVVSGSIDSVVGVLDIRSLLTLEAEHSITAIKAMTPDVVSVTPHQTLREALILLMESKQYLLIVIDDSGKVVGLVSLRDVVKALTGQS